MLSDFTYVEGKLLRKGKPCGYMDNCGYLRVGIQGSTYLVHRIIYKLHNPDFDLKSTLVVDHINRVRDDNRIENLRAVSKAANNRNRAECKGVSYCKQTGKWKAGLNGKWLGRHATEKEAINAVIRERENYSAA